MWNTMMGTSLLSMPWAIQQAGYANGIALLLFMAALMAYTSYRVLTSGRSVIDTVVTEFSDVVRIYLGRFAEGLALFCSVLTILGGAIVYWILMSNFLYHIVVFIYTKVHSDTQEVHHNLSSTDYVCTDNSSQSQASTLLPTTFTEWWKQDLTVPLFLVILVFPLINFKSPTFFTKFNAFGTISVTYLVVFVSVKAGHWGININFEDSTNTFYTENFKSSFPALTGVASLAFFLQNCVIAITRNQKHPENNSRDLIIAYMLVCFTYLFMGVVFYSFPMVKSCIADNLLDNIPSDDIMAFVARVCLFFQMMCVLPLLLYVMRTQLLQFLFKAIWPSLKHVIGLNILVLIVCVLFAIFIPNIGRIISFVGAFCGLSYAIALPCIVYIVACHVSGTLTHFKLVVHVFIILLGVLNFIAQFLIL